MIHQYIARFYLHLLAFYFSSSVFPDVEECSRLLIWNLTNIPIFLSAVCPPALNFLLGSKLEFWFLSSFANSAHFPTPPPPPPHTHTHTHTHPHTHTHTHTHTRTYTHTRAFLLNCQCSFLYIVFFWQYIQHFFKYAKKTEKCFCYPLKIQIE